MSILKELRTMGRWPTVGELFEYYSREDICAVIYYQSKRWRILMNFGDNYLLEPTSEQDVRRKMLKKLKHFCEGVKETDRLPKYPTMHILKDRGETADVRYDFMTEDDPRSWQQAFSEMSKTLDVLDAHDVFYRVKFSGHRSLHLMIPAESLPRDFRGGSINEQFKLVEKKIKGYLPATGHVTVGFRVVYSTHPIGAMVSIPLTRREIPSFQPWMANIYTVAVDFDWFQVPEDAVERNESFLNLVFDSSEAGPSEMSFPAVEPLPVRAYSGDTPLEESEVLQAIESEHPQERVAVARAALIQDIKLPQEKLKRLLTDSEADALWFGTEMAIRDAASIAVEDFVQLLCQKDDYLSALAYRLLEQSAIQAGSVLEYIAARKEIDQNTVAAVSLMAEMDWQMLVELPMRISASSLQEWFEKIWVICGAALCLNWRRHGPEEIFESAYCRVNTYEASEDERNGKVRQLELLFRLRNRVPRKRIEDEILFQPAEELMKYGHDLRGIVLALLNAPHPFTSAGATRLLTRLWWDDSIDMLIQRLDSSSSPRKSALRALVDIGGPAVEPLIHAVQTSRNQRIIIMSIEALGQLDDPRAIPAIRKHVGHQNDRVRSNARRVLDRYFGIKIEHGDWSVSTPDAQEAEEH
ncbi:HEAT repeat domain-containing protein [Candidatus Poribacteria bacterium]